MAGWVGCMGGGHCLPHNEGMASCSCHSLNSENGTQSSRVTKVYTKPVPAGEILE